MQKGSESSTSTNCSPEPGKRRLGEIKQRLSMQIRKIIDDDVKGNEQTPKETKKKNKVYSNLNEVQCMKDVKSYNGFHQEYQIGKKLGEGCHSSVYKCESKKQNKQYAVKILKEKDSEIFSEIREGYRILKKLEHQNIIQAKNLFINQKNMTCHLVLQYCEWQGLDSFILKNQKISRQQISQIISQLLKTVDYIHTSGVCHRDVKPDNILYNSVKKKIKLVDFEVARIRKYSNSKLQMMTKTGGVSYRAPQIFDSVYDERVDIWAVGVIAYQLLTGKLPFQSEYEKDQIIKIQFQEPDYSSLNVWEQQLVQRLLNKDPKKRPTANEALFSPFLFMHSKVSEINQVPVTPKSVRSSSLGKKCHNSPSPKKQEQDKFYDDDVTKMFLGGSEGDIGVIRWEQKTQEY